MSRFLPIVLGFVLSVLGAGTLSAQVSAPGQDVASGRIDSVTHSIAVLDSTVYLNAVLLEYLDSIPETLVRADSDLYVRAARVAAADSLVAGADSPGGLDSVLFVRVVADSLSVFADPSGVPEGFAVADSALYVKFVSTESVVPDGFMVVDTVVFHRAALLDSLLFGKDILAELSSFADSVRRGVDVRQSEVLAAALRRHIAGNGSKTISGYRIRIFFDNKQSSRVDSEAALKRFEEAYPEIAAYRSYVNPYFKVTVGDFRTRSEAMYMLERVKLDFPTAFIVREHINFPIVDRFNPMVADTLHLLRPVPDSLYAGDSLVLGDAVAVDSLSMKSDKIR